MYFPIQPKEKTHLFNTTTLRRVWIIKALCLATIPELALDLHMACDPCHDFRCFRWCRCWFFFESWPKRKRVCQCRVVFIVACCCRYIISCSQSTSWKTWIFRKISTCQCCRILISAGWQSRDLNPSALDRTLGPCLAQHPLTIHLAPSLKRFWYQSVITVVTLEILGCGIAKLPGLSVCGRQLALCRDYFGKDSYGGSSSTFGHVSPLSQASLRARCQMLSYIHLDPKST